MSDSRHRKTLCVSLAHRAIAHTLGCVLLASILGLGMTPMAKAQAEPAQATQTVRQQYTIAAGPLALALRELGSKTNILLTFLPEQAEGKTTRGINGAFTVQEAFDQLLIGTDLELVQEQNNSYALRVVATMAPSKGEVETVLPVVRVVAGEDKSGTSEGTGAYTTNVSESATKLHLSLRETPQSVSVVTRTQMDDFGLRSAKDVLASTTGVNVERVETDRTYYTARGFDITNFKVDGLGLPFVSGGQWGDIDTAIYDRVEILRGANGLISSTGNPSATINFVRKRPTNEFQASAGITVGSWKERRVDGDISGALNESGSVRGRVVAAKENTNSYLERYSLDKTVFSGIIETDISDKTLLTFGLAQQQNKPKGVMWGALPLYFSNGTPTNYDVSKSTAADWTYWFNTDTQSFAEITHDLGNNWQAKAVLTHKIMDSDSELFYVYGTPDATTGLGLFSYPSKFSSTDRQLLADASISGPFDLAGRTHELVLGTNWSKNDTTQYSAYGNDIGTPLPNFSTWNGNYPKPAFNDSYASAGFSDRGHGLYASARFNLADDLKLLVGGNAVHVDSAGLNYGVAHKYSRSKITPYLGTVYDLDSDTSLYASYAGIFNPQTEVDVNHAVLAAIEGNNLELGTKSEWLHKRLNTTAAVFRTKQKNTAEAAGTFPDFSSYYRGINATSTGIELDVAGQLTPRWEISGGYTQLTLKDDAGRDARTFVPRKTLRLNTTYKIPDVEGLKVGMSLKWQSDIYVVQTASITTRQGAYGLLGLVANYDFDKNLSATLNLNNVTNQKYLTSLYWTQSYYGAPRNAMLTLNWKN